jgi:hypothetical protein
MSALNSANLLALVQQQLSQVNLNNLIALAQQYASQIDLNNLPAQVQTILNQYGISLQQLLSLLPRASLVDIANQVIQVALPLVQQYLPVILSLAQGIIG